MLDTLWILPESLVHLVVWALMGVLNTMIRLDLDGNSPSPSSSKGTSLGHILPDPA